MCSRIVCILTSSITSFIGFVLVVVLFEILVENLVQQLGHRHLLFLFEEVESSYVFLAHDRLVHDFLLSLEFF